MKKIINGRRYDTATAQEVASDSYGIPGNFEHWTETLYRTQAGAWFLVEGVWATDSVRSEHRTERNVRGLAAGTDDRRGSAGLARGARVHRGPGTTFRRAGGGCMSTAKGKDVVLRLDPEVVQEIRQAARRGHLSFNAQIVAIIEDALKTAEQKGAGPRATS